MSCRNYRPNVPHHSLHSSSQGRSANYTRNIQNTYHSPRKPKSYHYVPDFKYRKPGRYWNRTSSQRQSMLSQKEEKQVPSRITEKSQVQSSSQVQASNLSTQDILEGVESMTQSTSSSRQQSHHIPYRPMMFKSFPQIDYPATDMELSLTNYMLYLPTHIACKSHTSLFENNPWEQLEYPPSLESVQEPSVTTSEESMLEEMTPVSSCSINIDSQSDQISETTSLFTDMDIQSTPQSSCQEVSTSSLE